MTTPLIVNPAHATQIAADLASGALVLTPSRANICGACERAVTPGLLAHPGALLACPDWCGWCARALSATAQATEADAARPMESLMVTIDERTSRREPRKTGRPAAALARERLEQARARRTALAWERWDLQMRRIAVNGYGA